MISFLKKSGTEGALTASACRERYAEGSTMLDVRTPAEYEQGHLACATNVDVMAPDFRQQVEALGLDATKPVYLYCRSGKRSGQAAKILRQIGFQEAYNVGSYDALRVVGFETA